MSRTTRGSKGCGYDYWSRRSRGYTVPGRDSKRAVARAERQDDKDHCHYETYEKGQCEWCGMIDDLDAPVWWCEGMICGHCADQDEY